MAGVLERIGKGLVSFGTGIPQIELDAAEIANRNNSAVADLNELQVQRETPNPEADARMLALREAAAGGDEIAMRRLIAQNPEIATQTLEAVGIKDQQQREEASLFADQLLAIDDPVERDARIRGRIKSLVDRGRNPEHTAQLLSMDPEQQNQSLKMIRASALAPKDRIAEDSQKESRLVSGADAIAMGFEPGSVVEETVENGRVTDRNLIQGAPSAGQQIQVGPDGTVTFTQGGPAGVSSGTQKGLEESVINAQAGLSRLRAIGQSFNAKLLELPTQAKAAFLAGKEKLGGTLSTEEKKLVSDMTTFRVDTLKNLNNYIKEVTGAAMSAAEADRITQSMPNMDQSGTEFLAAYSATMRELNSVQARSMYALRNGLDPKKVPLSQIGPIIDERGQSLMDQFTANGMSDEEADAATKEQLRREFGLQ